MSITVEKVLDLPSMYGAKVVAGHSGLSNPVEAVSVSEYGRISDVLDQLFDKTQFEGNEIIITSFADVQGDVDAQCLNIHRYHAAGSVGFILFYVGLILPEIDQKLIDCCNELGFVLICMPPGMNHKYADVIGDISFALFKDQQAGSAFVSTLISRFSRLPSKQQSISTLLRMLSNHLQATIILTDRKHEINHIACWPQSMEHIIEEQLADQLKLMKDSGLLKTEMAGNDGYLQQCPVLMENGEDLLLFIFKFSETLSRNDLWQSSELIQLYSHIWNDNLGKVVTSELVRAIIEDEPLKMKHLSDLFHIQVEVLNQMWVFVPNGYQPIPDLGLLTLCQDYLSGVSAPVLVGYYKSNLIAFSSASTIFGERKDVADGFLSNLKDLFPQYTLVYSDCLDTTADVREAYMNIVSSLEFAQKIYPHKHVWRSSELLFIESCYLITQNRDNLKSYLSILRRLEARPDLLSTLCTYLLECNSNMQATSQRMCCHLNTIKYRLRQIRDLSGYAPTEMPDAYSLYIAAILSRLQSDK